MVEEFKRILQRIITDKGSISVFAILKMDEVTNKWSVILSAPWIQNNDSNTFNYVRQLLLENLTTEQQQTIARIGIFSNSEHIVQVIRSAFKVQEGATVELKDSPLNGFKVHEGYIFASN